MIDLRKILRRARRCEAGTAVMEFALATPLLLLVGLWGVETANLAISQMRVNQIASLIADNASRIGERSLLGEVKIYESDINDLLLGAELQAGNGIELRERGRVILSSLEVVPGSSTRQYIHWQRCLGELDHESSYGDEGDGLDPDVSFPGMGPKDEEVIALPGSAVMFVEVAYRHHPVDGGVFGKERTIIATAAFTVRENRDLARVYQRDEDSPDTVARCDAPEA